MFVAAAVHLASMLSLGVLRDRSVSLQDRPTLIRKILAIIGSVFGSIASVVLSAIIVHKLVKYDRHGFDQYRLINQEGMTIMVCPLTSSFFFVSACLLCAFSFLSALFQLLATMWIIFQRAVFLSPPPGTWDDPEEIKALNWICTEYGDVIPTIYMLPPSVHRQHREVNLCMLYSHGNAMDLADTVYTLRALAETFDCAVMGYEYPGYGMCAGSISEDRCYAAIAAAFQCFGEDTRVLTSKGFLFMEEVEQALAEQTSCDPLLFACYDSSTKQIVYRTGKFVPQINRKAELINLTQSEEQHRWSEGSDEYGRNPLHKSVSPSSASQHISLRVTADHDLYVQLDAGSDASCSHLQKHKAETLLSSSSTQTAVLLPAAERGVEQRQSAIHSTQLFHSMGWHTQEEVDAGLWRFGFEIASRNFAVTIDEQLPRWARDRLTTPQLRSVIKGMTSATSIVDAASFIHTASIGLRDDLIIACLHAGYTATFDIICAKS